jgi:hypothetical protein
MTKFTKTFSLSAIAVSVGFFAIPLLTGGAHASMTSELQRCQSNSSVKVLSCCNTATRDNKPLWMRESGANCEALVTCAHNRRDKRCYVKILVGDGQGSPNIPTARGGRPVKVFEIRSFSDTNSSIN